MRQTIGSFQFSLKSLVLIVALTSLFLGTVLIASAKAEQGIKLVAIVVLTVAPLLAAYCRGSNRAYWLGFFAFGVWSYVLMNEGAPLNDHAARTCRQLLSNLLEDSLAQLHREVIAERTRDHVVLSYGKPKLPADEMASQFPDSWSAKLSLERKKVSAAASCIAWRELQIALALLGGMLVKVVYEIREAKGKSRQRAA